MKKVYFDETENNICVGIFIKDIEVIRAGTTIYAMPVKDKDYRYKELADKYDVNFIFEDNIPQINFYTVPQIDIMAIDSKGGMIGTIGQTTDLSGESPICYIDKDKKCYLIAANGPQFLKNISEWKNNMIPYNEVLFYDCKKSAQAKLEFVTLQDIYNMQSE